MTELSTFITLSTAHMSSDTSEMLSSKGADDEHAPSFGDWRDGVLHTAWRYGHFVRVAVPEDADPNAHLAGLPPDLAACVRHAWQFGCDWIRFDRDADETPGLERHDW